MGGNLIHTSEIDHETGLITMAFQRGPDLRELKKLTDGAHNGRVLERSRTKIHKAVVLRSRRTEMRNKAAEMARKLATEMRTDLRSPSFNIPIPGQLRSSDDPMTLVDAKEALKILQECKKDDEEGREMWRVHDLKGGARLTKEWKNGEELEEYLEANPCLSLTEIKAFAKESQDGAERDGEAEARKEPEEQELLGEGGGDDDEVVNIEGLDGGEIPGNSDDISRDCSDNMGEDNSLGDRRVLTRNSRGHETGGIREEEKLDGSQEGWEVQVPQVLEQLCGHKGPEASPQKETLKDSETSEGVADLTGDNS